MCNISQPDSGFAGVEPLQRRYRPLQSCYESLRSRYESLPSRYESLRGGMAPRSLCLTTAFAPVPAFLGGSCPLGCSLSAPATGRLSMVSPQYIRYAAGSEEEKRAGRRLHGDTIVQVFGFCKGELAEEGDGRWGLMVTDAVVPLGPPSNVFGNRGTPPVPPAGAAPLHPPWGGVGTLISLLPSAGCAWGEAFLRRLVQSILNANSRPSV